MGNQLFDQYTYLHLAVGVIAYFWDISLPNLILLHSIFEFLENTPAGMHAINNFLPFWPGGKPRSDTGINILGDTLGAILGWISAYYIDTAGHTWGWYSPK